uniref:Uncharacterized protein n=1 Tax=Siphoviridae sp. ctnpt50 TaxID=2827941 RepID=A0A8S5SDF6_9CAUD|nr:MAG TPA: hypothetical protein [Siphoviridae sp. ctnpt50]
MFHFSVPPNSKLLFSGLADVVEHIGHDCLLRIRCHADSAASVVVVVKEEDIFFAVAVNGVFYALPSAICVFNGGGDISLHECALRKLAFAHFTEMKFLESLFLEVVRVNFVLFHSIILSSVLLRLSENS